MCELGFHESSIVELKQCKDRLRIVLEGVTYGNKSVTVNFDIEKIDKIYLGDKLRDNIAFELEDGEVLSLDFGPERLSMIVEWHSFSDGISETKAYTITGNIEHRIVSEA